MGERYETNVVCLGGSGGLVGDRLYVLQGRYMKYLGPPQAGSVASETYSRNPAGQYVRARVMPDQTVTARRLASHVRWQDCVDEWQTGTDAQRQLWNDFAAQHPIRNSLGASVKLSGFQWWMKAAQASAYVFSINALFPPPTDMTFVMGAPTIAQTTSGGHTTGWTVTPNPSPAPHQLVIYSCGPLSSGVTSLPGRSYWRWRGGVIAGGTSGGFSQATSPGQVWGILVREWTGQGSLPVRVGLLSPGWVFRDVTV